MAKKDREDNKEQAGDMPGDTQKKFFTLKNVMLSAGIAGAGVIASLALTIFMPVSFTNGGSKVIYITYGSGFKKISRELDEAKLLRNRAVFNLFVIVTGSSRKLQAGEYEFNMHDSMNTIACKMVKGDVLKHRIVVPEGSDIYDIAGILEENRMADKLSFLKLVRDRDFLRSIGINRDSAEGLLFPDTYYFVIGESVEKIIETMYSRFGEKSVIVPEKSYTVSDITMSGYKLLKLASIIEKESKLDEERPKIASVFYNRMKSPEAYQRRLESCATVRYALNKKTGAITYKDTRVDSPFNTYVILGTPPTPISNPGIKSMEAALHPAETNFRYFVAKDNGEHTFSETLEEHEKAKVVNRKLRKGR
jgi:UPF0755 protein